MKRFSHGDRVKVERPGRPAFVGTVYHVEERGRGRERLIYVKRRGGCGEAYLVRYVTPISEAAE